MSFTISRNNHPHHFNQLKKGDKIYYNLKLNNIYNNRQNSKEFKIRDDTSIILEKQKNYRLTIQSFRLDLIIPVFLFPIKEGFVNNNIIITNITKANPAVITTAAPHGLNNNDYINMVGINGMNELNGIYFVSNVLTPTTFTVKNTLNTNTNVNSSNFSNYISGGRVDTVNDNVNLSDFGLCLSVGGNDYSAPVLFIPDKNTALNPSFIPKTPKNNNGLQDNSTFYYYTYSFKVFEEMLNTTLQTIMAALNAGEGTTYEAPYFLFENNRFNLIVPYDLVSNNVDIFVNTYLNNYLVGFRTEYNSNNDVNFKDIKYIIKNYNYSNSYVKPGSALPVPPSNPKYLKFEQEYDGRYKFDLITSVIMTSNYIRTRNEYYPKVGNPNSYFTTGKSSNDFNTGTQNIISTFDFINSEGNLSWREVQYYYPKIYKWIDLISDDPLNKIDAQLYFETKRGELLPVYIDSDSSSIIRLLFERIED